MACMQVTLMVKTTIDYRESKEDPSPDYMKKLDKLVGKLEKMGLSVDVESEEELDVTDME